jgi:hypothetical protein
MLYKKAKFSVPASAGDGDICANVGSHCGPDAKGRCLRCGTRMRVPHPVELVPADVEIIEGAGVENEILVG